MRVIAYVIFVSILLTLIQSCSFKSQQNKGGFPVPYVINSSTINSEGKYIYFQGWDENNNEKLVKFSIPDEREIWSKPLYSSGVVKGIISSNEEYVLPVLSDTILFFDIRTGQRRFLKTSDRCKISPLESKGSIVFQDRELGLVAISAETLKSQWTIPEIKPVFTMPQPVINNNHLIGILNQIELVKIDFSSGKVLQKLLLEENSLNKIYLHEDNLALIVSNKIDNSIELSAYSIDKNTLIWRKDMGENEINWLENSALLRDGSIYCKGNNQITIIDLSSGMLKKNIVYESEITSNILLTSDDKVAFTVKNKGLVLLSNIDKEQSFEVLTNEDNVTFFKQNDTTYVYFDSFICNLKSLINVSIR